MDTLKVRSSDKNWTPPYPGHMNLELIAFHKGDPAFQNPQGNDAGMSLAAMRASFEGDEGQIIDQLEQVHLVSLKPWAEADPDTTFLQMRFTLIPDEATDQS